MFYLAAKVQIILQIAKQTSQNIAKTFAFFALCLLNRLPIRVGRRCVYLMFKAFLPDSLTVVLTLSTVLRLKFSREFSVEKPSKWQEGAF